MQLPRILDSAVALGTAILATAVVASGVQTLLNIGEVEGLGLTVTPAQLAQVAWQDPLSFGPIMAAIVTVALVPALIAAQGLTRRRTAALRAACLAGAGLFAVWGVFQLLARVTPMPALVVATGTPGGLLAVSAAGAFGGLVYAWQAGRMARRARECPATRAGAVRQILTLLVLLALPVTSFLLTAPGKGRTLARVDPASYAVQTLASGLARPWAVASLPDGRLLVTEMAGRLLVISAQGAVTPVDLSGLPGLFHRGGSTGLMDIVLDPAFAQNRQLYLTLGYGEKGANGTRLLRATWRDDALHDVQVLFSSTPKATDGSNGGRLAFLPDGTLVLSVGDGTAPRMDAQNPRSHQGKLVRLDRDGRVPDDNPFAGQSDAAPGLYTLGHKNVQGLVFDPASGTLLIAEHGARGGDELNAVRAGANYGWPLVTGGIDYSFARVSPFGRHAGYVDPLWQWSPSMAPSALALYDHTLFARWQGSLLVSGLRAQALHRVMRDGERIVDEELLLAERGERLRDVHVASDGAVLVLTDGPDAKLLRLVPSQSGPGG